MSDSGLRQADEQGGQQGAGIDVGGIAGGGSVVFQNFTPQPLTVRLADGTLLTLDRSGEVARVSTETREVGMLNGLVPLSETVLGQVTGLPASVDGVMYVVSLVTKSAADDEADAAGIPRRTDLVVPGEAIRDEKGTIIGCNGFSVGSSGAGMVSASSLKQETSAAAADVAGAVPGTDRSIRVGALGSPPVVFENLTPHALDVILPDGSKMVIERSGTVARVDAQTTVVGLLNGVIPLSATVLGNVTGLPDPVEGKVFVCSLMTMMAANKQADAAGVPRRTDIVAPGEVARDENGTIIGCKGLSLGSPGPGSVRSRAIKPEWNTKEPAGVNSGLGKG